MGFWSGVARAFSPTPILPAGLDEQATPPKFSVEIDPVMLYGPGVSATAALTLSPRVSRREAMSVPAVKRARDLITGPLGTLPLQLIGPDNKATDWALFRQPEPDVPRSITMIRTIEDLLFEQVAWWKVEYVGWHNKPVSVRRLDPRTVSVQQDQKVYETVAGNSGTRLEWIPDEQIIRFDGPNDALLVAGARAIRAAIALDAAALRHSDGTPPIDFFTPADGVDPEEEAVTEALDAWAVSKARHATPYIPGGLKHNVAGWNPEQLQMAEARQHAVLEIARCAGIDAEDLGVSTTSRTYFNAQDRKQARLQDTLRAFMVAIEDRLSMEDVTPRGYLSRFSTSDYLRTDDQTRMTVATTGVNAKVLTPEEGRRYFDPSLPVDIETVDQTTTEEVPADA